MAKVYVSSTVADLERERRAVVEWLVAAGHQPFHSNVPKSDTVRDSCLEDVDNCDLYVLIVGHRYGFQPAEDNSEGLSLTHLEFRRAGQSGKPRIALLSTSILDVRLSDVADPARMALVLAFRAEVARAVRPAEFSDLQGLIQALSTGVQAELAKLDDRSHADRAAGHGAAGPVLRLAYLAGTGKTSVAVEYAYRHLAEVGLAWQFAAEDRAVLAAGFAELAVQLGARDQRDARDPVQSVHAVLATYPADWLLVFGNAPDQELVARFLPPAGRGRVVITSGNPLWPPSQALAVPTLDLDAAAAPGAVQ